MNKLRSTIEWEENHVEADAIEKYAEFQPNNSWTGGWGLAGLVSGNKYAVSERERLQFVRSCAACENTGKVKCKKGDCTRTDKIWFGGRHMHSCSKQCPDCTRVAITQRHPVYLTIKVLKDATKSSTKYHLVGAKCLLMAIEEKRFNRTPHAAIRIGTQTYTVYTTDLRNPQVDEEGYERVLQRKNERENERRRARAQPVQLQARQNSNRSNRRSNMGQDSESESSDGSYFSIEDRNAA